MAVSSTRGATGQRLGAVGAAETVLRCNAVDQQIAPPTIHQDNPDPPCNLEYVPPTPREMEIDAIANNSSGFGGHNVTAIARNFVG